MKIKYAAPLIALVVNCISFDPLDKTTDRAIKIARLAERTGASGYCFSPEKELCPVEMDYINQKVIKETSLEFRVYEADDGVRDYCVMRRNDLSKKLERRGKDYRRIF